MSLFERPVDCDSCGTEFVIEDSLLASCKEGDLEVQYLLCPACGAKSLVFASDSRMQELVRRRKAVQAKIRAAHAKKFQKRAFEVYIRELETVKKEQAALFPRLRVQGEKLLHKMGKDSEPNTGTELHSKG